MCVCLSLSLSPSVCLSRSLCSCALVGLLCQAHQVFWLFFSFRFFSDCLYVSFILSVFLCCSKAYPIIAFFLTNTLVCFAVCVSLFLPAILSPSLPLCLASLCVYVTFS